MTFSYSFTPSCCLVVRATSRRRMPSKGRLRAARAGHPGFSWGGTAGTSTPANRLASVARERGTNPLRRRTGTHSHGDRLRPPLSFQDPSMPFTTHLPGKPRSIVARWAQLLIGLFSFAVAIGLMVRSGLGLGPWDAFHYGLFRLTGM